ncbi:MAG: amidohydrolase family protein [Candidatus Marinimicrobia bacterium]|nr:amidohydrolase family protein [Candidatus Neomarinimicrobiota bacterium]
MNDQLLVVNGTVAPLGERPRLIADGAVWIERGVIRRVGRRAVVQRAAPARIPELDAGGGVILPGFINAHTHLYSALARGLAPKPPAPKAFTDILKQLWWPLDRVLTPADLEVGARVTLVESIRAGVTTLVDHHESQGCQRRAMEALSAAVARSGLRALLALGLSDRYGRGAKGLAETETFLARHQAGHSGRKRVTPMLGLHALFTVNDETLAAVAELARATGLGLHVHVAEAAADGRLCREAYGLTPLERLDRVGLLNERTLAIHGVHLDAAAQRLLARRGAALIHNPQSNMNNAVGTAPVPELLRRGVQVGLGTDAMTADVRLEARVAHLLHKQAAGDPRIFFVEACELLLRNNAQICNRFLPRPIGMLQPGACGDIAVLDYDPPTAMTAANFCAHFLYGLAGAPVRATICDGAVLLADGRLTQLDERAIMAAARQHARRLHRRFAATPAG